MKTFSKFLFPLVLLIAVILIVLGKVFKIPAMAIIGAALGFLDLIIGFFILAHKTAIISDQSKLAGDEKGDEKAKAPYSISRTQLAYWTILIVIAYVIIWIVEGTPPALTGSTLVLLGISIGTTTAAKVIDFSQQDLEKRSQDEKSDGFLLDILSDKNGISIHRFQMMVWTVVLGVIFLVHAFTKSELIQFQPELLGLLGISNGAYLGLKIPENTQK